MNITEYSEKYDKLYEEYDKASMQLEDLKESINDLKIDDIELEYFQNKYLYFTTGWIAQNDVFFKTKDAIFSPGHAKVTFLGNGYTITNVSVTEITDIAIKPIKLRDVKILTESEFIEKIKQISNEFKTRFIKQFIDDTTTI